MSTRMFTHATPTLFNAGVPHGQLASCFLMQIKDDSIEGIYETLKDCAVISKSAGGIGIAAHAVRAKGSYIRGTGGISNGPKSSSSIFFFSRPGSHATGLQQHRSLC